MLEKIWFAKNCETFFITWSLHNLCNFRCEYCPPNLNNGTTKNVCLSDVIRLHKELLEHVPGKKLIFAFSGGEPTVHPEFIDMIKYLSENDCEVCMTTNGSRRLSWWEKAEPYIDHLVISYHPGWTKANLLKDNIDFLTKTTWVNLDLMMQPTHWDEIVDIGESFKKHPNIAVTYLPIQKDFGNGANGLIDYTKEQLSFLQNPPNYRGIFKPSAHKLTKCKGFFGRGTKYMDIGQGQEVMDYKHLIATDQNRFKEYECDLGLEGLIVEINGDIYNAYCHVGGKVGNVFAGEFNLNPAPIVCPLDYCSCSVDIEISKRKIYA